jgi:glycerol-3-phosphate acyltransferase PlsY
MKYILLGIGAFLLGSIPFSFIITKLVSKKDIRGIGSGNPGATNVVRALNIKYGILVLILDMAKGFFPVYLATQTQDLKLITIIALAVVIGHDFTPFLKFKGGKGVASSAGIFLAIAPIPTLCVALFFLLITTVFKFVSFGSVLASFAFPILAYFMGYKQYLWLSIALGFLIVFRHKENLKRLWYGKETRAI